MRFFLRLLIFVSLLPFSLVVQSQHTVSSLDKVYGLDPLLYNGRKFTFFLPPGTDGTPFLNSEDFSNGSATLRGIIYNELKLKYDLFNQDVVMQYTIEAGAIRQLVLSKAWLEGFSLRDKNFKMLAIQDTLPKIYQVIGDGPQQVLYSWYKELNPDHRHGSTNHVFSNPHKESWLYDSNKLLKYKNNRSFVKHFNENVQADLKKYLRKHHINLKKANDMKVAELLNFTNTLSLK